MTAEIAILNKSAVALAADSAVTISAGTKEEKIFFSADKLFELSHNNPIGIMIYNGMQFMQAPLQMLISEYRLKCRKVDRVEQAAEEFLGFLTDWGASSPVPVQARAIDAIVLPLIKMMNDALLRHFQDLLQAGSSETMAEKLPAAVTRVIEIFEAVYAEQAQASFFGGAPKPRTEHINYVRALAKGFGPTKDDEELERVVQICMQALLKKPLSEGRTGIVIAGFGSLDMFPSLASYEIDGMVFGSLKYEKTNFVDIDRDGDRARVLPFAQKEMVERFLYGIDSDIEDSIAEWVSRTIPPIKDEMLNSLQMSDEDMAELRNKAVLAENAVVEELRKSGFAEIRSQSRSAIDAMVEFMPKPELATMAEALVNLTSIKRRVSRGMETVGGPIDVALISKSEGFVWVKRKHYFSADLNPRYGARVVHQVQEAQGGQHAADHVARETRPEGRTAPKKRRGRKASGEHEKGD